MFQFPTFAHRSAVWYIFNVPGCPIRKSTDQIVCADPRSLSQLITSFVASESLGIHRLPLSVFAPKMLQVAYPHAGCILTYLICSTLFSRLFLSSMSMIAFCITSQVSPEWYSTNLNSISRGASLFCGCKGNAFYSSIPNIKTNLHPLMKLYPITSTSNPTT